MGIFFLLSFWFVRFNIDGIYLICSITKENIDYILHFLMVKTLFIKFKKKKVQFNGRIYPLKVQGRKLKFIF